MLLLLLSSAVLAMDPYDVVDKSGFRYTIARSGASAFAAIIAGATKPSNWVRAVDATCRDHHVAEHGWQGTYHVRFIERLDPLTQAVRDYKPIWGVPRHTMQQFYDVCKSEWPELPSFNTFRQAVAGRKTMKGFFVQSEPNVELTRLRCPLIRDDDQPGLPPVTAAAAPQSAVPSAGGAAGPQVCCDAIEPETSRAPPHVDARKTHGKRCSRPLLRTDTCVCPPRMPAGGRAILAAWSRCRRWCCCRSAGARRRARTWLSAARSARISTPIISSRARAFGLTLH